MAISRSILQPPSNVFTITIAIVNNYIIVLGAAHKNWLADVRMYTQEHIRFKSMQLHILNNIFLK